MLVSTRTDWLQLVTQPEHAALAGRLGAHWGNAEFPLPSRAASLLTAAERHDDGWASLDGRPVIAADAARPAHFLEVPFLETVEPYGRGVDSVYEQDEYAGVLTSMHWAGLYSARWGVQGGPPLELPLARSIADEQEQRWRAHARRLWGGEGLRSRFEAELWLGYEILQALDLLSLALCTIDTAEPTGVDALPVPATLREVRQPLGARVVPNVPVTSGRHVDVRLAVMEPGVIAVSPFPFAISGFTVELEARRMPIAVSPGGDPAAAYHTAPMHTLTLTIV